MRVMRILLVAFGILSWVNAAFSAELVMFRRDGCSWCHAWDREIGSIYPKTEIGRRAPLRMVDLDRPRPSEEIVLVSPVRYTPTFVLVAENREIARLEGYPGEDFFWGLLQQMILRLPSPTQGDLPSASQRSPEPTP